MSEFCIQIKDLSSKPLSDEYLIKSGMAVVNVTARDGDKKANITIFGGGSKVLLAIREESA